MGDTIQNQEIKNIEEKKEEIEKQESTEERKEEISDLGKIEGSAVKILRKKLEQTLKEKKNLEEKLSSLEEISKIANIDELLSRIDKLELENTIYKKFPDLQGEEENIIKERKEGESWEDAIYRYIGKKKSSREEKIGYSLGSASTPRRIISEFDLLKLPKEEQKKKAREFFKQIYGKE